jgi:hypothetical protein
LRKPWPGRKKGFADDALHNDKAFASLGIRVKSEDSWNTDICIFPDKQHVLSFSEVDSLPKFHNKMLAYPDNSSPSIFQGYVWSIFDFGIGW